MYDITYMWNFKKCMISLICGILKSQTCGNIFRIELWFPGAGGVGEMC